MGHEQHKGLQLPEGLLLATDPADVLWQEAEQVECRVFTREGYVESREEYRQEYEPYREVSDFIATQRDEQVVGAVRIIKPSRKGLKTVNDAREGRIIIDDRGSRRLGLCDLDREVVECNIAVEQSYRGNPFDPDSLSNVLVAGAVAYLHNFAAKTHDPVRQCFFLASLDSRYFKLLSRQFGPAVYQIGPPVYYMRSLTIPVLVDCLKMVRYDYEVRSKSPLLQALGKIAQLHEF